MSDPRPILNGDPSGDVAKLLGSSVLDEPPPGGRTRLLSALGVGTATASVATSATGAGAATAPAPAVSTGLGVVAGKWLAIGALAGVAVMGTSQIVTGRLDPSRSAAVPARIAATSGATSTAVAAPDSTEPVAAPRPVETEAENPVAPPPATPALAAPRAARRSAQSSTLASPEPPTPRPSLREEIQALDRVRELVASGHAAEALTSLDEFEVRFARPRLGPESALVRAEALVALARYDEARVLGERFLAHESDTPHAQRMQSLVRAAKLSAAPVIRPSPSGHLHDE